MTDQARWLTPAELRAWLALAAMLETLPAALDAELRRDAGVNRFEYMVMAGLSDAPGRSRLMSELAAFAAGSISRLSHAITRLEGQGWVERRPFVEDGRHTEVVLTDAGLAKMVAIAPGHVTEVRRLIIDNLTPAQLDDLGTIARTIVAVTNPEILDLVDQAQGLAASS